MGTFVTRVLFARDNHGRSTPRCGYRSVTYETYGAHGVTLSPESGDSATVIMEKWSLLEQPNLHDH
jgi:hypothetical protein